MILLKGKSECFIIYIYHRDILQLFKEFFHIIINRPTYYFITYFVINVEDYFHNYVFVRTGKTDTARELLKGALRKDNAFLI